MRGILGGLKRDGRAEARCEFEELNWMSGVEVCVEKGACGCEEGVRCGGTVEIGRVCVEKGWRGEEARYGI